MMRQQAQTQGAEGYRGAEVLSTGGRLHHQARLGDFLVQAGLVKAPDVNRALAIQQASGGRLGSILVGMQVCSDESIRKALNRQLKVEVVDLNSIRPNPDLFTLLSVELMRKYEVIPLKYEKGKLWIAMVDYYNLTAIDDIRFRTGISRIVVAACTERDYRRFVEDHLDAQGVIEEILRGGEFYNRAIRDLQDGEALGDELDDKAAKAQVYQLRLASSSSPIITLVNFLLVEAIRRQASDIHIEPYENELRIRLRIDGRLRSLIEPPRKLHMAVIARFKVMSDLDITKRRIPQDGHLSVEYCGEAVHFRVSTLPTMYGEKCVVRLLKKDNTLASIDQLSLSPDHLRLLKAALAMPQGLILVTGPTGSGKTTTLHAGLNWISNGEINVVTLEDPVEVTFPGINHVPIHQLGGVTFASGLRSILRQDPDVIFIGEMRDAEVASIAMRAAQTGHLVLSTLHTNSSVESVVRLLDMGIPAYLLASALLLVVAQRLVRRVCNLCAVAVELSDAELELLRLTRPLPPWAAPRVGRGCPACMESGFKGRVAVFEMLEVGREIRELLRSRASPEELSACVQARGGVGILAAGAERVLRGETTVAEVSRVLQGRD